MKNLAALLAAALNEKVMVTGNGKRRKVTKREAVITQLVNKSASAELRATKMLLEMLRRNMCHGCPHAAQQEGLNNRSPSLEASAAKSS